MFSNSRPVPSRAALRALYQLAYISSGTAVGVATLCAEERRRKTRLLQVIADNARRLHDSPRHVQNAQWMSYDQTEQFAIESIIPQYGPSESSKEAVTVSRRTSHPNCDGRPVRSKELASDVEKGYAQLEIRRRHEKKRKEGPGGDRTAFPESKLIARPREQRDQRVTERTTRTITLEDTIFRSWKHQDKADPRRPGWQGGSVPAETVVPQFRSRPLVKPLAEVERGTANQEANGHSEVDNIEDFFLKVASSSADQFQMIRLADNLLEAALKRGANPRTQSMILWRFAQVEGPGHGTIISADRLCTIMCDHLRHAKDRAQQNNFSEHVRLLFSTARTRRLPGQLQVMLGLTLFEVIQDLSQSVLGMILADLGRHEFVSHLENAFEVLLCADWVGHAHRALDEISLLIGVMPKALFHQTLDMALKSGELMHCARLIRKAETFETLSTQLVQQCEDFVVACSQKSMHYLRSCFIWTSRKKLPKLLDWLAPHFSKTVQTILARHYAHQGRALDIFPALDERTRLDLRQAGYARYRANDMQSIWKNCRSIPKVQADFEKFKAWAARVDFPAEHSRVVELAFIKILNKAGQTDRALQDLAELQHGGQPSQAALCAAAALLTRNGSWAQFDTILSILAQASPPLLDIDASKGLYEALQHYALAHSSQQTWDLAQRMIDELKISPGSLMTSHVLLCFVTNGDLHLIPQWLAYMRSIGGHGKMTSKVALKLMTSYYIRFRPPHSMLMSLCKIILSRTNMKNRDLFQDLISESIGFDMRNPSGNPWNMKWLRPLAQENLRRLIDSRDGVIPEPLRKVDMQARPPAPKAGSKDTNTIDHPSWATKASNRADNVTEHKSWQSLQATQMPADVRSASVGLNVLATSARSHSDGPRSESSPGLNDVDKLFLSDDTVDNIEWPTKGETELVAQRRRLERTMALELSQSHYEEVLDLYRHSLDASGIPISPRVLEIAVQACMHIENGDLESERLMAMAKNAGMNITCAHGPLIMHEIQNFPLGNRQNGNKLRTIVIDYYRMNEENGWRVNHHIATTAASLLIKNHQPVHALNLLNTIHQSDWGRIRPYDIATLTVYMRGYIAVRHRVGLDWVMRHIRDSNMHIDIVFLNTLRDVSRKKLPSPQSPVSLSHEQAWIKTLRYYREYFSVRRMKQKVESKTFGNRLVDVILQSRRDMDVTTTEEEDLMTRMQATSRATMVGPISYTRRTRRNVPRCSGLRATRTAAAAKIATAA